MKILRHPVAQIVIGGVITFLITDWLRKRRQQA
jgi:hypothetical protein